MKRTRVLYLEVADKIKEDIFSGKYPVGSMLPTESELEELFQVSKITVRKAIELLASDEYVEEKWSWDDGSKQSSLQSIIQSGKFYADLEELPI